MDVKQNKGNILLIGNPHAFIIANTMQELKRRGYFVTSCAPSVDAINKAYDDPVLCLFFLDAAGGSDGICAFLCDHIQDSRFGIILVGDKLALHEAVENIGISNVEACFERPLNMREICLKVEDIFYRTWREEKQSLESKPDEPETPMFRCSMCMLGSSQCPLRKPGEVCTYEILGMKPPEGR